MGTSSSEESGGTPRGLWRMGPSVVGPNIGRFGETIDIHLAVKAIKDRSIDYQFRIFRRNPDGSQTQAGKGHMTTILAQLCGDGELRSIDLPDDLRARIGEAPAELLKRPEGV